MAQINQDLLERLKAKLSIGQRHVYRLIDGVVADTMLDRHLAALVLARRRGININRYSTPQQRAEIRGVLSGGTTRNGPAPELADPAPPRVSQNRARQKRPKAKDNSVFVVHGRNGALR